MLRVTKIQQKTMTNSKTRQYSSAVRLRAIAEGYRSGLEESIATDLKDKGVSFKFEERVIGYVDPAKERKYTPDFELPNGIIIESKGRFLVVDRQKHMKIKAQHPQYDIRFVFSNSKSKLNKTSNTTYAMWCDKNGFKYADKTIPDAWLQEKGTK
jgi:hypothetical protein